MFEDTANIDDSVLKDLNHYDEQNDALSPIASNSRNLDKLFQNLNKD